MFFLRLLFIILALVSAAACVLGALDKRRNIGYLVTSAMISAGDIFCVFLLMADTAKKAKSVLAPYYILHAWFLFAFLATVVLIDYNRKAFLVLLIPTLTCAYQTYLMIAEILGVRLFQVQKRIYFRQTWWCAVDDSKNIGFLYSFRTYRVMMYINIVIILLFLFYSFKITNKIFRARLIGLVGIIFGYIVAEVLKIYFTMPIWIISIAYNAIAVLLLYFVRFYPKNSLREWSLDSFANDMSDGLILYDKHDDIIHVNDMIKNTLDPELVNSFNNRRKLEDWLRTLRHQASEQDNLDNIISYSRGDKEYYFKVSVRKIGGRSSSVGTLYILHDNTESLIRIRAMEQANEELERAMRMKSDFLANMSHEIRTPMNAVLGMAEIALREKDSPKLKDYLLQIQSSGKGLLNIINDILDYSKIESGKMEIIEDEYEPLTELSDIANLLITRIGDKPLELFMTVETPLPARVYGDSMRIRQVIINLANNAIKFTNQGMVHIKITCEKKSEDYINATIHVIDTGIGIREDDLKKLFVSFQQLDSRRNRNVEGTGLGLAISQRLVTAMGGEISVKSEYGKGSDFMFTVPLRVVDPNNAIEVTNASDKKAFLLCDNKAMAAMFIQEMDRLKVQSESLAYVKDYKPSGKKDFLFFIEKDYNEKIISVLRENPDLTGIILIGYRSEFVSDIPNLHRMRKPETTMVMVNMLNEKFGLIERDDEQKLFKPDFTAPDARVLIVDDNDINISIAEGLISPLNIQMESAGGGQAAIDLVSSNEYDIVFMDHMMPVVDGVDATKSIRMMRDSIHQPVIIALSANVMGDARALFEEAGMDDFLGKPIDAKGICEKIKRWLPAEKIHEGSPDVPGEKNEEIKVKANCEGLNIREAVRAFGSSALYDKIAEEYLRSGGDKYKGIQNAFEKEDWNDYTIRVHALKSSSRQIGAMELGEMAERLEAAGKNSDFETIQKETGPVLKMYEKLLSDLEKCYGPAKEVPADREIIEPERLTALLDRLEEACNDLDMDRMEKIDSELNEFTFGDDINDDMISLHKAVGDIDSEESLAIIERIRTKI